MHNRWTTGSEHPAPPSSEPKTAKLLVLSLEQRIDAALPRVTRELDSILVDGTDGVGNQRNLSVTAGEIDDELRHGDTRDTVSQSEQDLQA